MKTTFFLISLLFALLFLPAVFGGMLDPATCSIEGIVTSIDLFEEYINPCDDEIPCDSKEIMYLPERYIITLDIQRMETLEESRDGVQCDILTSDSYFEIFLDNYDTNNPITKGDTITFTTITYYQHYASLRAFFFSEYEVQSNETVTISFFQRFLNWIRNLL